MMLITVIFGESFDEDYSKSENFFSDVIPRVGNKIITKKFGVNIVRNVVIDYRHIQCEEEKDRGSISVFIFI